MTTKKEVKRNIMRRIMELRTKDQIEEDGILDILDDNLDTYIDDICKENKRLLESCEGATMMYNDLCKAKEIIKKYLAIGVGGKITQNYLDVTKEAEQFLKEN